MWCEGGEGHVGGSCRLSGAPDQISVPLGRSVQIPYTTCGLFFLTQPHLYQPGRTLAFWRLCQVLCTNGGEGKRVWLLLKLTDCLHLLSELCHMLECTTWLRLGRGGSHSCPSILLCSLNAEQSWPSLLPSETYRNWLPPDYFNSSLRVRMYYSNSNINQDITIARDWL